MTHWSNRQMQGCADIDRQIVDSVLSSKSLVNIVFVDRCCRHWDWQLKVHHWHTDWIDNCNVVPTLIDKCNLHVIDKTADHTTKGTESTCLWLSLTHRHVGASCWPNPSLIKPSLMWSEHVITLPTLAFTYDHACTQTVWVTLSASSHVVDMHPPPTNALHVRCMFVQLTWCELRCNQFDHWDIHTWCCYYTFYMWCIIDAAIYLTAICDVSSILQRNARPHVRPQHQNMKNTLLDHDRRTHC